MPCLQTNLTKEELRQKETILFDGNLGTNNNSGVSWSIVLEFHFAIAHIGTGGRFALLSKCDKSRSLLCAPTSARSTGRYV